MANRMKKTKRAGSMPRTGKRGSHILPPTANQMKKAIVGSGGLKTVIAERMRCCWATVHRNLTQREGKDWDEVREAYEAERESIGDQAEGTILHCMRQRLDLSVASQNARWMLGRRFPERGYGDKRTIALEGGDRPVLFEGHASISLEDLDLPKEIRLEILKAIRKKKSEDGRKE